MFSGPLWYHLILDSARKIDRFNPAIAALIATHNPDYPELSGILSEAGLAPGL
jgi:hypothetical protein